MNKSLLIKSGAFLRGILRKYTLIFSSEKRRGFSLIVILFLIMTAINAGSQTARIYEEVIPMKTYPFSDPNPVPEISRIYPYFSFEGYTNQPVTKEWKMVVLENDYIKVYVCPDIGGKVWGATEKSTGNEFLYFNHVVKFRNVAMRGPWTSGGLEYNFGDIGHIPTCSTPVDYVTKTNPDGSVSCIVGAIDLPSGTKWNVEISVHPGEAFFRTKAGWFNNTDVPVTYYHWMNAAAKSAGNLEFIYPGNKAIGHGGELGEWPVDDQGREIYWYDNNDFGIYKSYHVINAYTDYFGGYWHDDDFGFGHWSTYDDKPGKKIWMWGLSDQGMIWEDLLTDSDGQYIEFQAGKLFNQASYSSTFTPFKHKEFHPHDADIMNEMWFPLKNTGGMKAVSPYAVLNLLTEGDQTVILVSALQKLDDELKIFQDDQLIHSETISLNPLEIKKIFLEDVDTGRMRVVLGFDKLIWSGNEKDIFVNRSVKANPDFDWESAYGLFVTGLELEKQRRYTDAHDIYMKSLEQEPGFLPSLNRVALSFYRQMNNEMALEYIRKSLAIDAYDGEANYIFGLVNRELHESATVKSGFSIALASPGYRDAASAELAKVYFRENNYRKAKYYAEKALDYNHINIEALELLSVLYRKTNQKAQAEEVLDRLRKLDATNHFVNFEKYLLYADPGKRTLFQKNITNELPWESYLDLAVSYYDKGCSKEAIAVLKLAPEHPLVNLWLACLDKNRSNYYMTRIINASPEFVFPHRRETADILNNCLEKYDNWKLKYYLGLIYLKYGLEEKAVSLFESCADDPDYAPFWIVKARLLKGDKEKAECLQRAVSLAPGDWRSLLELADFYLENNQPERSLEITGELIDNNSGQSEIGMSYAKGLLSLGKYEESISFLEDFEVLPYEGATIGRNLYHEACLRMAFKSIEDKNYKLVVKYVQKAKKWPENLGVGRPYDVDERLEDYILSLAYEELGNRSKTDEYAGRVMDYVHPGYSEENSRLYLQLLSLQKNDEEEEAADLLNKFKSEYPENVYMKWVDSKINGRDDADSLESQALHDAAGIQPYDTKFIDQEFKLLIDFLKTTVQAVQ